jgi:hypothetical protein
MHEVFADRICSGMDRAVREQPFGPGMVVWTIDGHMFAAYTEAGEGLSLRVSGNATTKPSGLRHAITGAGWVVVPWATPPEDLRRRIAASYAQVLSDRNVPSPQD